MNNIKLWPHGVIIAGVMALAAGIGVALYLRHENSAQAEALPNAARIQRVDGEVALNDSLNTDAANTQWRTAAMNEPFSVGDRIYTREGARTSLAFNGRNFARLEPNTALDALMLSDTQTQLALRQGSAIFDVGYLNSGDLFEVGTPYGAVDFNQPGLYQVGINDGDTVVSVLSGLAQVVGMGGRGQISKGEMLTLAGAAAAEVLLSRLNSRDAGYVVDDYYRYQYGNAYDGRYASYDTYLNDPFYYDPYRRNTSYRYVTYTIPGVNDLDYYGDWQNVGNYGYVWVPRVDSGWVPYQQGYWTNDYPYGLTWVSTEPWGYAPYHYGRWASVDNRWVWIPEAVNTTPRFSPALVAFMPFGEDQIGWVPLGPGDPYVARYYDESWQPHYLTRGDVAAANLVNLGVPNAVTVIPVNYFDRPIDRAVLVRTNPQMMAQVRPTLEPLLLTPLRNAVLHSAWGRGKIALPPGIAKKLNDTPVVVSTAPSAPLYKKDLAKSLRVESIPDRSSNQKLKIRDERQTEASQQTDAARQQRIEALGTEAAKGNRDAGRQMQALKQQQKQDQPEQGKVESQGRPAVQSERVGNPAKPRVMEAPRVMKPKATEAPRPMKSKPIEVPRPQTPRVQPGPPQRSAAPQTIKQPKQNGPPAAKPGKPPGAPSEGKGKGKKP